MPASELEIVGYKSHLNTRVPLSALTVLVGPNGVGKTSCLDAIEHLANLPQEWGQYYGDILLNDARRDANTVRIALTGNDLSPPTALEPAPTDTQPWWFSFEATRRQGTWNNRVAWKWGDKPQTAREGPFKTRVADGLNDGWRINKLIPGAQRLRLDIASLVLPSIVDSTDPVLAASGAGLAAVLSQMYVFDGASFKLVVEQLRAVVPSFRDLRTERADIRRDRTDDDGSTYVETVKGAELKFDFSGATDVPTRAVSEGTLIALAVLVAAHTVGDQGFLLLDDIDRGLHPRAQRELVAMLRKILSGVRLVATAHSPYLVDSFEASEVVVLGLDSNGAAVARRLSEHPDAKRASETLSTGEFLAAEEEGWVVEVPGKADAEKT